MSIFASEYIRCISLEKNFMNYSIDDLLYGAMAYLATYLPKEGRLYLTKKNYAKNRKNFYNLIGSNGPKTLKRHLDKLIERGLIAEEEVEKYPSYTFPYSRDANYQMVEAEMLWYIVSTRNQQAVKVYVKLLNWYLWKQKENEEFIFTNKDIMKALGYSTNSNNALASSMVSNILESFKHEGVIEFEEKIMEGGNSLPTPKKRLVFVAKSKNELK